MNLTHAILLAGIAVGSVGTIISSSVLIREVIRRTATQHFIAEREHQQRRIHRQRARIQHRLNEGFTVEEVAREFRLPMVIVQNEQRILERNSISPRRRGDAEGEN